jgi:hypothetical protein
MLRSQITNTQTLSDPIFLKPNAATRRLQIQIPYFLLSLNLLEVISVHRSVTKDNIFGVSYVWTHILTPDDCETGILDNESDLPTTPPHNYDLVPSFLPVTVKRV